MGRNYTLGYAVPFEWALGKSFTLTNDIVKQVAIGAVGSSTDQNIADTKIEYDTLATCGAMLYAESQNEPNNEPFWYQCNQCSIGTSFLPCAKYQRDLYQLIHYSGDPLLTGKSVVGMSEIG